MINLRWGLGLLLIIVLGFGCKTPGTVVDTQPTDGIMTADDHLKALVMEQVQAEWMSATARINFNSESMSIGGTANIRMQKDERIWMSIKKFGFEVGRAMVTADSVYILDRINNEYAAEPLSYVENRFRLPADLTMLQQLLLGNPVFMTTTDARAQITNDELHWQAKGNGTTNDFYFAMPTYQLRQMKVDQEAQQRALKIQLADYRDAGANRDFSYLRTINVNSKQTGVANIEFEFTKVEVDQPTTFPFQIPERYQRNRG